MKITTAAEAMAAVRQDGRALQYVPYALRTPDLCLAAVQQSGCALEDVPDTLWTPEICLAAVQQDGFALQYVPEALHTPDWLRAAQPNDTLATALDRFHPGLGAHCTVLQGLGLTGEDLDTGLHVFLASDARVAVPLPDLETVDQTGDLT